jgi:hypothetical protein
MPGWNLETPFIETNVAPTSVPSGTVTVVVPGQTSEDIDEVEITGSEPEHPISAPNLKRDEATAALDDGE